MAPTPAPDGTAPAPGAAPGAVTAPAGPEPGRRDLLARAAALGLAAAPVAGLLGGCASGGSFTPANRFGTAPKSPANPFGVARGTPVDVVVFKGGFGDAYARTWEAAFDRKWGTTTSHLATQEITAKLQPRFNGGNPPDVVDDAGAQQIKLDVLLKADQLADLTPVLDAPSPDDPTRTVRSTLIAGTVEQGTQGGRFVALNYVYTVFGLWYSAKLFEEQGWTPPRTWDAFLGICAKARKAGIGGLAHQGRFPYYINVVIMDLIAKKGGPRAVKAIDDLEPHAFAGSAAALAAVEAVHEVAERGLLMPGTNGLTHTEAQTAWNQYRAAFLPCGSWLENEQLKQTPADFGMTFLPVPVLDGSALPVEAVRAGAGEPFIVPARAANRAAGMEFVRSMLSREWSTVFARQANALTVLKDGVDPRVRLRPGTRSVRDSLRAAGPDTFTYLYPDRYSEMDTELQNASNELMAGRIRPREWIRRAQAAVDRAARTPAARDNRRG